jgi:hypothetical protein
MRTITHQSPIGDWEDPEIFDKRCPALEYWLLYENAANIDSGSDLVGIEEPDELTGLTIKKPHIVLGSIF